MNVVKSISISESSILYLNSLTADNFSAAVEQVIQEHRTMAPEIRKAQALEKLRSGAYELKLLGIDLEPIQGWVRAIVEQSGE